MVPKDVSVGDNLCMCLPFLICFGNYFENFIKEKISSKFPFQNPFSIGFNVGTFHRLLGLFGFFYLLAADFWTNDPREFGSGAVRTGGGLTASSSWRPNYTPD
jgi:hypothetical protein